MAYSVLSQHTVYKNAKAWNWAYNRIFHKILYKVVGDKIRFITKLGDDNTEFIGK